MHQEICHTLPPALNIIVRRSGKTQLREVKNPPRIFTGAGLVIVGDDSWIGSF